MLNALIDKLQATFPPNRIMLWLAGPIVALSAWISALVTTNVPGVTLPTGIVAGVIGAAALITISLLYKWFDHWQEGERIDYQTDVETAVGQLADTPEAEAFYTALGTMQGVGAALADLRARLDAPGDQMFDGDISNELAPIGDLITNFLAQHLEPVPVASPPAAVAPPAAPQPAE
jgi:hypothetical protein